MSEELQPREIEDFLDGFEEETAKFLKNIRNQGVDEIQKKIRAAEPNKLLADYLCKRASEDLK